jgi:hypothetical protein
MGLVAILASVACGNAAVLLQSSSDGGAEVVDAAPQDASAEGQAKAGACTPVRGLTDLLESPLPAGGNYGYGVLPQRWQPILGDTDGDIFFEVDPPQVWRWLPATGAAAEMPGFGAPDAGAVNLYFADRGQVIWAGGNGLYATDIATGVARQLVGLATTSGFGSLVGLDASNVYGAGSICPRGACPFTISGVARAGGSPFVAYQTAESYWTQALRADDSGLYWSTWGQGGLYHAALTNGAPAQRLVELPTTAGRGFSQYFGMDACNVYWIEWDMTSPPLVTQGAPHVMAIAKPNR